jgi:DNA-binding GntR family transcriptional regulator
MGRDSIEAIAARAQAARAAGTPDFLRGEHVEFTHAQLRSAILRGDLAAGETVSQVDLAAALGVSRTPLKEAIRLLQREGLIESEPNRRIRIAVATLEDMEELYVARLPLEAVGVRLTVPRMRSDDIAELEGLLAQMAHFAEQRDHELWERPHRRFHAGLLAGGGLHLRQLCGQLADHTERYRRFYQDYGERAWSAIAEEHRAIVAACRDGDTDLAVERLVLHLSHTALSAMAVVAPDREPVKLLTVLATITDKVPDVATGAAAGHRNGAGPWPFGSRG